MGRPLIVDGGLATGLEALGHELHPQLWSAGVFLDNPGAVEELHRAYLTSGAEILVSASYQMSFDGLARVGLNRADAAETLRRTVAVARRAAESAGGAAVIVAASVGPYGAVLADGSEYRGDYGLSVDQLVDFHRERFEVLLGSGADLLAVETLPSLDEALALCRLIAGQDRVEAWVSFSCRDASCLCDGQKIQRAAAILDGIPQVKAVGVNCTAPEHVAGLMDEIREATDKPIIVYPNSGERWDPRKRQWIGASTPSGFCRLAEGWARKGAWAVGGCCRVGPDVIQALAASLRTESR